MDKVDFHVYMMKEPDYVMSIMSTYGTNQWLVGSCTNSVEVLDVQRGIVWSLPDLTSPRPYSCSMVTLSDCLLVLGGGHSTTESLALTVYQKHERCYKFVIFLIEIEFLGRPNRKWYV